mgnify:CR=1 FL=1
MILGNDNKFEKAIDEELLRLQGEITSTKNAMAKAMALYEDCKSKQQKLIVEMKAVDMMKQSYSKPADLQQPPADYFEKKSDGGDDDGEDK